MSLSALVQHFAELWVVLVLVHVMDSYMPDVKKLDDIVEGTAFIRGLALPLQIVRPRISVLPLRAEWAYVARTAVYESMPDHFVLALESSATFGTRTPFY